ncbi:MAG: hypothetical protein JW997_07570, partial [Actinobacteria bacterium]|nr:hypothetical protein [Actinomycetota bacterium]
FYDFEGGAAMRKVTLFVIVSILVFFISASPLFGFTVKGEDTVNLTGIEEDDVYVMGGTVNFSGEVNGDLVAAGGRLNFDGTVLQDLIAAGGYITMDGEVKDDIRIAGGDIAISGNVGDDVIAAGGELRIENSAKINGDLVITGGKVNIAGEIDGKIIASGGEIIISGKAGKGVEVGGAAALTIENTAVINGDLVYTSDSEAKIADGASISGSVKFTEIQKQQKDKYSYALPFGVFGGIIGATYIGSRVISFISIFVLGIILLLAIPAIFKKFNSRMESSFGYCTGGGAIMLFGIPVAMLVIFIIGIILLVTIIGSGLGIVLLTSNIIIGILYFIIIYTSTAFLAFLLGKVILSKTKLNMEKYGWKVLAYLIGLVIIMIVYSIPFVGGLARFAGILFGFGGIMMIIKDYIWNAFARCVKK